MRFEKLENWLAWQETFHPRSIDLGLSRVRPVYRRLAAWQRKPLTITVAGTNGKGSCIAFLSSILQAAGYNVGAYTSPHILCYNERIQINGKPVEDEEICAAFDRVDNARCEISLTYFEFGTLAALDLFSAYRVDIQLLEVGLGGRLDAVNIVDADAMLITCIEIDHVDWLGESREVIGLEKAGVFRTGIGAVIGEAEPPRSILHYAEQNQVPLSCFGEDFSFQKKGSVWNWSGGEDLLADLPFPALQGEHQLQNASSVLETLRMVQSKCPVSIEAVRRGLETVSLAGRFQHFPGHPSVLLDVAHNPHAAGSLANYLKGYFPGRRIVAVFSLMQDKDIAGVVANVQSLISHWIFAPLPTSRCVGEAEIIKVFSELGIDSLITGLASSEAAFNEAHRRAFEGDLIVVFGSFFLVAEFLKNENRFLTDGSVFAEMSG
jgi:dihydrofolate synthase/folylpolyglutamate synthase